MTDQHPDSEPALDGPSSAFALSDPADPAKGRDIIKRVLNLEYVMNHARLEQREVPICLAGDLSGEYARLQDELADLVDVNGQVLADGEGDAALSDQSRAEEISERLRELSRLMAADTFYVTLRAMPEDQFEAFEAQHRSKDGSMKDRNDYYNRLISITAVAPTMNIEQVKQLRTKLNHAQIQALVNAAYSACAEGGVDVPKLPSFLPAQKPQE